MLQATGRFSVVHPHSSCVDSPRSLMVRACVRMLAGPFARGLHSYVTIHREILKITDLEIMFQSCGKHAVLL